MRHLYQGFFIVFEGIDGAGKTTQAQLLRQSLEASAFPVIQTREPGGSPIGEKIRSILLKDMQVFPVTELLLFLASRNDHVKRVIQPALQDKKIVISDRFYPSSYAYQAEGRGVPLEKVKAMNQIAMEGTEPDVIFLIDLSVEEAMKRVRHSRIAHPDLIEATDSAFYTRVKERYLAMCTWPNVIIVDGESPIQELHQHIDQTVRKYLDTLLQDKASGD